MNRSQLGIDISIDVWGPGSITRIASIRKRLNPETVPDHEIILRALDDLENTYLKPGFVEHFHNLVPREHIALCHNDVQEGNILMKLTDASKISLIDFEYGMWNPMCYDLGNYLNEMVCDNSYPHGVGIRFYWENQASDEEIELITKHYFKLWA